MRIAYSLTYLLAHSLAQVRGCIPVVLSDPISFPYEMLLDYTQMTLKLPEQ